MISEKDLKKITAKLDVNYDLIVNYHLNAGERIILNDSVNNKCRFCGKSSPEVSFKKDAHVLSHMIGNKYLLSTFECDVCNARFSQAESEYSQFMGMHHSVMKIRGKHHIPKFKDGRVSIDSRSNNLSISVISDKHSVSENFIIDKENKILKLDVKRNYIPSEVWKAITKMALSVLPEEYLSDFQNSLEWLKSDRNNEGKFKLLNYPVVFKYYPLQFPFITTSIFRRKNTCQECVPGYIFILAYSGIYIEMPITGCSLDEKKVGEKITLPIIPNPLDLISKPYKMETLHLTENKRKEEFLTLCFGFKEMEEAPIGD